MGNILTVVYEDGTTSYRASEKIWQYNYGQILRLQGFNLPKTVEVQFSYTERGGESITRIATSKDNASDVVIPDSMLENSDIAEDYKLYAFVYVEDGNSGTTEYKIAISVRSRPKPELHETPETEEIFKNTIKLVNQYADEAEQSNQEAQLAKESAELSAESAKESASSALTTKQEVEQLGEDLEQARNNAVGEVNELKQESLSAVETAKNNAVKTMQAQEETSKSSITKHTNEEIDRANASIAESKKQLDKSISDSVLAKTDLDDSIESATQAKQALDSSINIANTTKSNLDSSTTKASSTKQALDSSTSTANTAKSNLDATNRTATSLDTSLKAKIDEGNTLKDAIISEGQKQLGIVENASAEIVADREQINQNKADIALKANQVSLDVTNRKLDALWNLNQGVSYQFEEDNTEAYSKEVPTGSKIASIKSISGRSIVWNQLIPNERITQTVVVNEDVTTDKWGDTIQNNMTTKKHIEIGHIMYGKLLCNEPLLIVKNGAHTMNVLKRFTISINYYQAPNSTTENMQVYPRYLAGLKAGTYQLSYMLFDLTRMFGAGNEPTAEEFESMFPDNYYEYNGGEVISAGANEVVEQGENDIDLSLFTQYGNCTYEDNTLSVPKKPIIRMYSEGINCSAKSGDIIEYEYKVGTAVNVRLGGITTEKVRYDLFNTGSSSSSWEKIKIVLRTDIIRLFLNWTIEGSFYIRNFSVNGKAYHQNVYQIPNAIKILDGYGCAVDNARNELDLENKQYIQRLGLLDLGSLVWRKDNNNILVSNDISDIKNPTNTDDVANILCAKYNSTDSESVYGHTIDNTIAIKNSTIWIYDSNAISSSDESTFKKSLEGIELYYELKEPIVYDISELISEGFLESIEVEAGGTLTFKNTLGDGYKIPVPSEVEYVTKLSEVADTEVTT